MSGKSGAGDAGGGFTFLHACDSHLGTPRSYRFRPAINRRWAAVKRQMADTDAAFLLHGGDLTRDGEIHEEEYALARADLIKPRVILMDEPSIGLAPRMIEEVYEKIQTINAKRGVTFLIVEQNARKALSTAHRGYVLDLGVTRIEDTGIGLLNNEEVKRLYLGG